MISALIFFSSDLASSNILELLLRLGFSFGFTGRMWCQLSSWKMEGARWGIWFENVFDVFSDFTQCLTRSICIETELIWNYSILQFNFLRKYPQIHILWHYKKELNQVSTSILDSDALSSQGKRCGAGTRFFLWKKPLQGKLRSPFPQMDRALGESFGARFIWVDWNATSPSTSELFH